MYERKIVQSVARDLGPVLTAPPPVSKPLIDMQIDQIVGVMKMLHEVRSRLTSLADRTTGYPPAAPEVKSAQLETARLDGVASIDRLACTISELREHVHDLLDPLQRLETL
jgi:hypothetical protein